MSMPFSLQLKSPLLKGCSGFKSSDSSTASNRFSVKIYGRKWVPGLGYFWEASAVSESCP